MEKDNKINKYLMFWILFVFSVVLYKFVESGFYKVMVYTMYCSPLFFLFKYKNMYKTNLSLICVSALMFIAYVINPESFRISTVLYTGLFFITFLLYKELCQTNSMKIEEYKNFIKYIIYAYTIILVIQQIQVTLGLSVFNKQPWFFENKYKLNSLSMEPSNTLLIIPLMMFSYIRIVEIIRKEPRYNLIRNFKEDKYIWFSFLYICLTSGSLTVFFSLSIFFSYFLNKRVLLYIPLILFIGFISFSIIKKTDSLVVDRFLNLVQSLDINSKEDIVSQDASASVRIVPFIEYFKSFNLFETSTWLGHGIDQFEFNSTKQILDDNFSEDRNIGAKSILALFYDHGLVAGLFFLYFLLKNTTQYFWSFETLFYLTLFSVVTLNHYVLWLYILLMYTNLFFAKRYTINKVLMV